MLMIDALVAALAMVLVVSGVLKVRTPEATLPMLEVVGLSATRVLVFAVALAEIVVGVVALVFGGPFPALAVGLLYGAFAGVSLLLLRADDAVSCGCFGQSSARMSLLHVVVNAVAAVVGLAGATAGVGGLFDDGIATSSVLTAVAALAIAALVIALLTVVPARLEARSQPAAFATAPVAGTHPAVPTGTIVDIVGTTPAGAPLTIELASSRHVTLLAFLTSGCTTCARFWDTFAAGGADHLPGPDTRLVVVTRGADQDNPTRVAELARLAHPVVMSTVGWADYHVEGSPYFVLIDGRSGRILGEGAASLWSDVADLVGQAVAG